MLRAVREHGLVAVGAGDGVEQRRVGRVVVGRVGDRGQQQLARGVPVDVGLERDATLEAVDGQVLGLRQRVRAAVGLRAEGVRGAFLVDAALGRVVAVRVDAVLVVAVDAVRVVVADGLAPEAVVVGGADAVVARDLRGAEAAGEGEVVAVRVLDRQEPELTRLDELADLRVVLVLGEPDGQAAAHLGGDPLARVVDGREQDRVARAVGHVARVLGHLDGVDRLAERRGADLLELHHVGIGGRGGLHLVGDAARLHVGAVDVEERVRAVAERRGLRHGLVDRERFELDAAGLELGGLLVGGDDLQLLDGRAVGAALLDVEALGLQARRPAPRSLSPCTARVCRRRRPPQV